MPPGPRRIELPRPLRALGAVASGALVGLAYAPTQAWPLLLIGLAAFTVLLAGRGLRASVGLGYLFGVGLTFTAISWLAGLGWWIAALFCLAMSGFFAFYGLLARLAADLPGWPVWVAGAWLTTEFLSCRFPFGGFGWLRAGYPFVDSPLAGFYPLVGVTGVGLVAVLLSQTIVWGAGVRRGRRRRLVVVGGAFAVALAGGALAAIVLRPSVDEGQGSLTVGVVQGNVNGVDPLDPSGRARTVTMNHLSETVTLMARAHAGVLPTPDVVLWPENSTDVDPLLDAQTNQIVRMASRMAGKPLLMGAVLAGPGEDERQTAGLWWQTDATIGARYEKRNLVPFGEYIPHRDALLPLFPILRLTGAQSVPGTLPGALRVTLADGRPVVVGDVICFELAWDATVYDAPRNGAQMIMVQSNNASYGGTPQIGQQWTMTRVRAMETGRDIAVATTNSLSGIIRADGRVTEESDEFASWSTAETVPLRSRLTPALTLAPAVELVGAALGLLGALGGVAYRLPWSRLAQPRRR